jgi:hypothetical protein
MMTEGAQDTTEERVIKLENRVIKLEESLANLRKEVSAAFKNIAALRNSDNLHHGVYGGAITNYGK